MEDCLSKIYLVHSWILCVTLCLKTSYKNPVFRKDRFSRSVDKTFWLTLSLLPYWQKQEDTFATLCHAVFYFYAYYLSHKTNKISAIINITWCLVSQTSNTNTLIYMKRFYLLIFKLASLYLYLSLFHQYNYWSRKKRNKFQFVFQFLKIKTKASSTKQLIN